MSANKPDELVALAAEARNELQRGWRIFKAFEHADKALAALENLEQLATERQKVADAALAAYDKATADKAAADADLKAAKTEAQDLRAEARAAAKGITGKAEAAAQAMLADAQAKVDAMTAQVDQIAAEIKGKEADLVALNGVAAKARATIARAERLQAALAEGGGAG